LILGNVGIGVGKIYYSGLKIDCVRCEIVRVGKKINPVKGLRFL